MLSSALLAALDFLHCVQKERGLVGLYLCAGGGIADELERHYAGVDETAEKLRAVLPSPSEAGERLFRNFSEEPVERERVRARRVDAYGAMQRINRDLGQSARDLIMELMVLDSRNSPVKIATLTYLLRWKERVSRERDKGTLLLTPEWTGDGYIETLRQIIHERQAYERLFFGLADETRRQACAPFRATGVLGSLSEEINIALAAGLPITAIGRREALESFTSFNTRIDGLAAVAKNLAMRLGDDSAETASAGGSMLDMDIENHLEWIKSLALFRHVDDAVLRSLLRTARIAYHDKDNVFLAQGDVASALFIVCDGWVKIAKETAEGDESVLHVLGRRGVFLDMDLFQDKPSPVSACAVTKVKLLTLPVATLRDHVARHKELATALLAATTRHVQRLIGHFERLTLRNATERVGWFLLDLGLESGAERKPTSAPIALPYDKALIAAYLGIKPETFSRQLQGLRTQGFILQRHRVTPPEAFALCAHCDSETAGKCALAGTKQCPKVDSI